MRGIVLGESLIVGHLPSPFPATVTSRYPHLLSGRTPVEVVELAVTKDAAPTVAMLLSEALKPKGYYAHLLDATRMYVIFPDCVAIVRRNVASSVIRAQRIGVSYGIPLHQMRFSEIFENDHPDILSASGRTTIATGSA